MTEAYEAANPAQQAVFEERYASTLDDLPMAETRAALAENGNIAARVNLRNNVRQGDESLTPSQFIYEAADCRPFYTPQQIRDQSLVWEAAYSARWQDAPCVEGSTGQQSSAPGLSYFPNVGAASNADDEGTGDSTTDGTVETATDNSAALLSRGNYVDEGAALLVVLM